MNKTKRRKISAEEIKSKHIKEHYLQTSYKPVIQKWMARYLWRYGKHSM